MSNRRMLTIITSGSSLGSHILRTWTPLSIAASSQDSLLIPVAMSSPHSIHIGRHFLLHPLQHLLLHCLLLLCLQPPPPLQQLLDQLGARVQPPLQPPQHRLQSSPVPGQLGHQYPGNTRGKSGHLVHTHRELQHPGCAPEACPGLACLSPAEAPHTWPRAA